jgi:hypothetical protein
MKIHFLAAVLVAGIGVVQPGESHDLDVSDEQLSDWKKRGLVYTEGEARPAKAGSGVDVAELEAARSERDEAKQKAETFLAEVEAVRKERDELAATLSLVDKPEEIQAVVHRNGELAEAFEAFYPTKPEGLNKYNEAQLRSFAIALRLEGPLPELKEELKAVLWPAIEKHRAS